MPGIIPLSRVEVTASITTSREIVELNRILESAEFAAINVGRRHSCGLRAAKTLTCWGNNYTWTRRI